MKKEVCRVIICLILACGVLYGDIKVLILNNPPVEYEKISYSDTIDFRVLELTNNFNQYMVSYEKLDNVDNYKIEVLKDDKVIVENTSNDEKIEFTLPTKYLQYGESFNINISAYKGTMLYQSDNSESFAWEGASFNSKNATSMNNKKYTLKIDGNLDGKYRLVINKGKKELYNKKITKNKFVVPEKYYKDKNVTLEFNLLYDGKVISTFKAKNKKKVTTTKKVKAITTKKTTNKITDIDINTPVSYLKLQEIKDIDIEYSGGDNAKNKYIYIYENGKLLKKETLNSDKYTLKSSLLKKDKMYIVTIEAVDGKNKKSKNIAISTIIDGRSKMVELAKKQIGNKGNKYWKWYGYGFAVEWCAVFVSWLSGNNGYIDAGILPKFSGCGSGVRWFKNRNQFKLRTSGYVPEPGDIIFFDYDLSDPVINHVGIVEYVDASGKIHTIEGNIENKDKRYSKCSRRVYEKDDIKIYGYGVPNY